MPKLVIKKGIEEGKVFDLADGTHIIGRGKNNSVSLANRSISKEHVRLTVNGNRVELEDLNSANGTFVNGALVKNYRLKQGDRINLHESTLELVSGEAGENKALPENTQRQHLQLVSQMVNPNFSAGMGVNANVPNIQNAFNAENKRSKKLVYKINSFIQDHVLPLFYKMVETIEWRYSFAILFFVFTTAAVVLTIAPLSTQSKQFLQSEARKQATFITKQLAEENRRGIYLKNEVILSTKIAEGEDRVLSAAIVDKSGRIMAPASRMNLNVSEPQSLEALKHEDTFIKDVGEDRVLISEPIKIFSQEEGKNIIGGFAQVIYSLRGIGLTNSGITKIFISALIWALLLGTLVYFLLVRITLRPLELLASDIEQSSSSGFNKLKRRFRFQAIDEVLRKINHSFWQLKTGASSGETGSESIDSIESGANNQFTDEDLKQYQALSQLIDKPLMLLGTDGTIRDLNSASEQFLNISREKSLKQPLQSLFIDIALMSTIVDLMNQVSIQKQGPISENISTQDGQSVKVSASPIKNENGDVKSIIVQLFRED